MSSEGETTPGLTFITTFPSTSYTVTFCTASAVWMFKVFTTGLGYTLNTAALKSSAPKEPSAKITSSMYNSLLASIE